MKDLFVLAADADIEATMNFLLKERHHALGIRCISFTIMREVCRDSGCRRRAASTARGFAGNHKFALVLFDKAGCGDEQSDRQSIQHAVEQDLRQVGWGTRSKAIVIEPELEMWVWSGSPHVGKVLGWDEGTDALRVWLCEHRLWPVDKFKPPDPKSALKRAMRVKSGSPKPMVFKKLAKKVSLRNCGDPAFLEMCETLQDWFPTSSGRF